MPGSTGGGCALSTFAILVCRVFGFRGIPIVHQVVLGFLNPLVVGYLIQLLSSHHISLSFQRQLQVVVVASQQESSPTQDPYWTIPRLRTRGRCVPHMAWHG